MAKILNAGLKQGLFKIIMHVCHKNEMNFFTVW